jgi:RND family efflux transporter MFP subunit
MKKVIRIVVIIIVILLMAGLVIKRKKQAKMAKPYGVHPIPVHVASVESESLEKTHDYLGVVEANRQAMISSRISARVNDVPLTEGDIAKKGELLLQLDDQDLTAEYGALDARIRGLESTIKSLEANLEYWTKENDRNIKLADKGVIPRAEADQTGNQFANASAKLQTARDSLKTLHQNQKTIKAKTAYTKILSPFDGLITARNVDPGDLAGPGKTLMVLEDRSVYKLVFDAPQEDAAQLSIGLPIRASINNQETELKITHIYPSFNRSRMIRVEAEILPQESIRIGTFIPLSVIFIHHKNATTIPRESLMQTPSGKAAVFVVDNGILKATEVDVVMMSNNKVEVKGLQPGQTVVTSTFLGWTSLASGLKVEVAK